MQTKNLMSFAGKRGNQIRSDCYFEIELTKSGGIDLEIKSKVLSLYGDSIKEQVLEMCNYFGLKNARILLEDSGALPFILAARFELAVRRLNKNLDKEFLPEFNKNNLYHTSKDKIRRSRLYLPGNEPKFFLNAGLHQPDGIILD
ncbi:MAG TPA: hypothetical protein VMV36_05420, partial [Ignavibacteriaceae bacterium]|nr:hypothetical protein [Ignavibacteriaceae bacterium]